MSLNNLLNKYSQIFFYIGLSVFNPIKNYNQLTRPHRHGSHLIRHYIYIAIIVFLVSLCWIVTYILPLNAIYVIITIMYLLGSLMCVTSIVENYLFFDSLPSIHYHFYEINLLFNKYRSHWASLLTYKSFEQMYQIHTFLFLIIFVVHIVTAIIFLERSHYLYVAVPYFLLEMFEKMNALHVQLYIDLHLNMIKYVNAFICEFDTNTEIELISIQSYIFDSTATVMLQLQLFKLIHHKLWIISKLITKRFGWTMVIINAKTFIGLTYSVFYVFVRLEENYKLVLRKY